MDAGAVLGAAGIIIAALLGLIGTLLGLILRNTRKVHEQVANNHIDDQGNPINMRDDLDDKFDGLATLVKGVAETQKAQTADIGGLRAEIRQVRSEQADDREAARRAATDAASAARKAEKAASDALVALERTQPKPYPRRKPHD